MSRGAQTFRQSDVTRAIKAAEAAGKKCYRVELAGGKINIIVGEPAPLVPAPPEDPFEQWKRQHDEAKAAKAR